MEASSRTFRETWVARPACINFAWLPRTQILVAAQAPAVRLRSLTRAASRWRSYGVYTGRGEETGEVALRRFGGVDAVPLEPVNGVVLEPSPSRIACSIRIWKSNSSAVWRQLMKVNGSRPARGSVTASACLSR
ncbi:hypothetical protein MTO96_005696 [Rhipicephalus appendiculatus]